MSPTLALAFTAAAGFIFGVVSPAVMDQVVPDPKPTTAASAVADTPTEVGK